MKKVYQTRRYKHYAQRKTKKLTKRAEISKKKKRLRNLRANIQIAPPLPKSKPNFLTQTNQRYRLIAPREFCLASNPNEVLSFFEKINTHVRKRHRVFLELNDVSTLEPDALVYLVAMLELFKLDKVKGNIQGNMPADSKCRHMFQHSGFLDFVRTDDPLTHKSVHFFRIEKHKNVDPIANGRMLDFCLKHLKESEGNPSFWNYRTTLELMGNTVEHAVSPGSSPLRWFMAGVHNTDPDSVRLVFLDTGRGIPNTITTQLSDTADKFISTVSWRGDYEATLVRSAFDGTFRSQTNQPWRGNGLPAVKDALENGTIKKLTVISNKAYLNFSQDVYYDLKLPLRGTLFTWTFEKS